MRFGTPLTKLWKWMEICRIVHIHHLLTYLSCGNSKEWGELISMLCEWCSNLFRKNIKVHKKLQKLLFLVSFEILCFMGTSGAWRDNGGIPKLVLSPSWHRIHRQLYLGFYPYSVGNPQHSANFCTPAFLLASPAIAPRKRLIFSGT